MIRISVKYGVVTSLFLMLVWALSIVFDGEPLLDPNQLIIDVVVFTIFIGFATKEFRSLSNPPVLHFWQGMTVGFVVYMVAVSLFVVVGYFYAILSENFLTNYQANALDYYSQKQELFVSEFGEEMYEKALDDVRNATISQLIWGAALKKVFAAFLVTPVISVILRKKPN